MKLTVKQYAARAGIAERTVRDKLARGVLTGVKEPDPVTGIDVWWIEVPDVADPPRSAADPPADAADPPEEIGNVALIEVLNHYQGMVEKFHRENIELAGRVGFLQAKLQDAEARILELEAPKQVSPEITNTPSGNGQDSQDLPVQVVSNEPTEYPQAKLVPEASATSISNGQDTSSGGRFKRFWRWLTQPV